MHRGGPFIWTFLISVWSSMARSWCTWQELCQRFNSCRNASAIKFSDKDNLYICTLSEELQVKLWLVVGVRVDKYLLLLESRLYVYVLSYGTKSIKLFTIICCIDALSHRHELLKRRAELPLCFHVPRQSTIFFCIFLKWSCIKHYRGVSRESHFVHREVLVRTSMYPTISVNNDCRDASLALRQGELSVR